MTWKQTFRGHSFESFAPDPEVINLEDIAHHLSNICRYGGATKFHYSVAQHCYLVADNFEEPETVLRALLHDAVEAYSPVGDMSSPDKQALKKFAPVCFEVLNGVDVGIERAICRKFRLRYPITTPEVHAADMAILHDERAQVMTATDKDWALSGEPLGVDIYRWSPAEAKTAWLDVAQKVLAQHLIAVGA